MRLWPYLRHKLETLKSCIIKEFAKEDRNSWRVVKLSESDKVSVSEDEALKRSTAEVVEETRSVNFPLSDWNHLSNSNQYVVACLRSVQNSC
jgi:hypothetical protein